MLPPKHDGKRHSRGNLEDAPAYAGTSNKINDAGSDN
jgi:hypothetical protein